MKREKDREKEEENGRRVHRPMQYIDTKTDFAVRGEKDIYIYRRNTCVCILLVFFFLFFFSNNKDSLFSDNKYFLTGRAGFHARSNWLGYPFFPRPISTTFHVAIFYTSANETCPIQSQKSLLKILKNL